MRIIVSLLLLVTGLIPTGCTDNSPSQPVSAVTSEAAATPAPQYDSIEAIESAAVRRDVPYVPTPEATVDEMLRLAKVSRNDVVYDLGSGDGRIVITAAKKHGARGVGYDIDPERIREANDNARAAGVTDRVRFVQGDLFEADLSDATAVTLYLLRSVNLRLRPKLLAELKPGTPVVSHDFDMGEWEPVEHKVVGDDDVYLWIIPARLPQTLRWTGADGAARTARLKQEIDQLTGTVQAGSDTLHIRNGRVRGSEVSFELTNGAGQNATVVESYTGKVNGKTIQGHVQAGNRRTAWRATGE